jgi:ferredoxin
MSVKQRRRDPIEVSLIYVSSEELTRHLVGDRYEALAESIEEAGGADEVVLYVVGGGGFVASLRTGWSIEQAGSTVAIPRERVVNIGRPGGALIGASSQVGALLLDGEDVDIAAPLTFAFDRGRPDLGTFRVGYTSRAALVRMAEAERAAEPERVAERAGEREAGIDAVPEDSANLEVAVEDEAIAEVSDASAGPDTVTTAATPSAASPILEPLAQTAPAAVAEQDGIDGGTIGASWPRIRWTLLVIALACLAFFTKNEPLRWVSLATTMVLLGWIEGGFLSISHVTGLVWVGFSAIASDPSLLIMAVFTVATVLLWGRLFCGFLCPFGALQDFVERFVPRRFKRELPADVHRAAWKAKYVILAVIVGAAIIGVEASLYQYFEPFGTVFFLSSNALLWAIAGVILVASAVVPRFYCRYVCPLGALLAVGSVLSLRRIPRVEQCQHCRVCEQKCPTGAITGPTVDFVECVRCNVCEIQLIERRGVCRHDMEEIRPRLVQIQTARVASADRRQVVH